MKNNKIIQNLLLGLIAISFISCGGGGNTIEGFNGNSYEEINIEKYCTLPDKIDEYIMLKSGDQIVKDVEGTKISILHDENNVKKVCLNSGTAHINRKNVE